MFRKAQLRLFAVITGILVAIFITVLILINILTQTYMQKQSRDVLQQVASGTEYDEKTETFSFVPPDNDESKHGKVHEPPKEKSHTTTESNGTTAENTEKPTDKGFGVNGQKENATTADTEYTLTQKTIVTTGTSRSTKETARQTTATVTATTRTAKEVKTETTATKTKTEKITETRPVEDIQKPTRTPFEENIQSPTENRNDGGFIQKPTEDYGDYTQKPDNKWEYDKPFENFMPETNSPFDEYENKVNDKSSERNNDVNNDNNYPKRDFSERGEVLPQSNENTSYEIKQLENLRDIQMPPEIEKPNEPVPKTFGSVEFFVLMADKQGNYMAVLNNDDMDETTAQSYITNILNKKDETGVMSSYQFYNAEKSNGTLIALTDKSNETKVLKQFMRMTVIIGSITLIVLSLLAYYLSKKSIEPIKAAFEKQKRFISDASHELKTPLTVISANADVLSGEIGENKWLNYIKSQTDRMNLLVNDLLNLTRIENNSSDFICTDFSLSKAVTNTALPFECRAFENNKKFIVDVEDNIMINGSERHIKQMTAIFIDNALKYSNDGGMVKVKLRSQGDKKILSVYNTGMGIKNDEKDKVFERFYRSDDSRSRMTGGYGLGLAIAKSIIDRHKFKVTIENEEGKSICFIVTM